MSFSSHDDYEEFMREAPDFERMLTRSGLHLTKFWFSVTRSEQRTRFIIRRIDPVRQWKLSPMDIESLDKWDAYTDAKEAMFHYTDTEWAPWTVVKSNDKKRARLEAIKHVLRKFDYEGKDESVIGEPDKLIIGPPPVLSEHNPDRVYPGLLSPGRGLSSCHEPDKRRAGGPPAGAGAGRTAGPGGQRRGDAERRARLPGAAPAPAEYGRRACAR
jgi:hypothetical protein